MLNLCAIQTNSLSLSYFSSVVYCFFSPLFQQRDCRRRSLRLQEPVVGVTGEWTWQKLPSQPRPLVAVTNLKNRRSQPTCKAVTNAVDAPNATAVTNAMYCTLMTWKDALWPPPTQFSPWSWSWPPVLHPSSAANHSFLLSTIQLLID